MAIELEDRRKALEEAFFKKENEALLEKMRKQREGQSARAALSAQTGVTDETVLDALLAQGVDSATVTALQLVPIVAVAWASGRVEREERKAVLEAAADNGVVPGEPAFELLEGWLDTRPADRLLESWIAYTTQLWDVLGDEDHKRIAHDVIERAEKVARAAGGILGIGSISRREHEVIDRLKAVVTR